MGDDSTATHRLVLVRHAKSDYPPGVADHERPLNARGMRDAPFIGSWIRDQVPWPLGRPPIALVSTAHRAQSTWALARKGFDDRWRTCEMVDEPRIYEAGPQSLRQLISELDADLSTVVIVGHNPGLVDLVASICVEDEELVRATQKFPTSSVAVLETDRSWAEAATMGRTFRLARFTVARAAPHSSMG